MTFYDKAKSIDRLKDLNEIVSRDRDDLQTLIAESSLRAYFFNGLKNPAWFTHLYEIGCFRNPPSPLTNGDTTWVPKWEVMDYLITVAAIYPKEVTDIIESIPPINSVVLWGCVKIGMQLPAVYTSRLVSLVPQWLNAANFAGTNFGIDIGGWLDHLAEDGQIVPALSLLEILTTPKKKVYTYPEVKGFAERRRIEAIPSIDPYGFQQLLSQRLDKLSEIVPLEAAITLQGSLHAAIEMESDGKDPNDWSYLWRPAIEDHSQNWGFREFKDIISVALRNVLGKLADHDANTARGYIENLLVAEFSIFNRLALHTIRTNKDRFWDLSRSILGATNNYHRAEIHHEFFLLLRDSFLSLSESEQGKILDTLFNSTDVDAADLKAAPEVQEKQRLYWSVSRLEIIKDYLHDAAKLQFEEMAAKIGPVRHPTFLTYHETSYGEVSPTTTQELKDLSPEEVIQYMRDFEPKPGFRNPTPAGLARTFAEDFRSRPDDYLKLSYKFLGQVRPDYVYVFVDAIEELRNSGKQLDWDLILDLFSRFIRLQGTPNRKDAVDSGWTYSSVRRRIADIMQLWLRHQMAGHIPFKFKEQSWDIVSYLCYDDEPDEKYEKEFGGSNMNPPTLCINTVRGRAMHALMEYALWYAHYMKDSFPKEGAIDRFEPRVKDLLNTKLNKTKDSSPAIHSTFGQFLTNLNYLDMEWLRHSISLIFPEDERYWKAAWGTYVSFSPLYSELYTVLRHQYLQAIGLLPNNRVFLDQSAISPENSLAEHIMVAYLNSLDSLEVGSRTDVFFKRANDHQRSAAIGFIGELASREDLFGNPDAWKKAMALWEHRLNQVSEEKEKESHQEEFTAFLGWAENYVEPLSRLYGPISASLLHCKPQWSLNVLLKYISSSAQKEGRKAIDLFDQLMQSLNSADLMWFRDEVKDILSACIMNNEDAVKQKTIRLINTFGEAGFYEFRDLLPPVSQS